MSMQIDYLRVALSLALCLGLGVAAIFLLRSRFRGLSVGPARDLSLLESLRVDPRTAVHVLAYQDQRLLLTTRDNAVHVTVLPAPATSPTAAVEAPQAATAGDAQHRPVLHDASGDGAPAP